jgi:hypothetical protein
MEAGTVLTLGADGTVSGSHVYADDGVYTATVCVIDDDGASACDTLKVEVAVLDQQQLLKDGGVAFWSDLPQVQTFTPSIPGKLVGVDLALSVSFGFNEMVHVSIVVWDTNQPGVVLGGSDFFMDDFTGTVDLSSQNIILNAGYMYGIVLTNDLSYYAGPPVPNRSTGIDVQWDTDPYSGGSLWTGYSDATNWIIRTGTDVVFATYMEPMPDSDGDGVPDIVDACPGFDDTADGDGDGVADGCDACPVDNPDDTDGDGVCDSADACPVDNPDDTDGDGVCDSVDACPGFDDTADGDGDGVADGCDPCPFDADNDIDVDGICADVDNCPNDANPDQRDIDSDTAGDACDVCPNDDTDTCNQGRSGGGSASPGDGGNISTPDGSVVIDIPPGAVNDDTSISITETGTSFELTSNLGNGTAVFGVSIQPEGTVFNVPITITFSWTDDDTPGKIDGTNIQEDNVIITKDNVAVTDRCKNEPGPLATTGAECNTQDNYFKFQVLSLSEFAVVFVDELGPATSDVVADPSPVAVNTSTTLMATVDDSLTGETVIGSAEYRIDEGDYSPMSAQDGNFDSVVENVEADIPEFIDAGVYTLCVRGWDTLENVAGFDECMFLPVYDPNGGFVTGGGWIYSPPGAYKGVTVQTSTNENCVDEICDDTIDNDCDELVDNEDPECLEGKANFGFVSKYKKGATVPTGVTEFQFNVADLNFHSNTYEWLVIAGAKAQYKGVGTINGEGEYKFMLSGIDADMNDNDNFETDKFKIRIWWEEQIDDVIIEHVVYDNALGDDSDDAMTEIGGGSIVIHKGKK